MLMTGGGVVDPDTSARSYDELPFFARFILENILPAVIVDGVAGGFESETAAAAPVEEEEVDETEFDATQYCSTQNVIENHYEDSLSPPPSTPAPSTTTTTTVPAVVPLRKAVDKKMLDEATYAALLSEKAKYDAEVEHLKEKTACKKIRRELLQIELFEKKRCFEEVRAEDLMKT
uniref:Uncharacterized protein n=1 Tax=Plectus sambesii TaxID=2011161 RepID=A0A914WA82_9BILA